MVKYRNALVIHPCDLMGGFKAEGYYSAVGRGGGP